MSDNTTSIPQFARFVQGLSLVNYAHRLQVILSDAPPFALATPGYWERRLHVQPILFPVAGHVREALHWGQGGASGEAFGTNVDSLHILSGAGRPQNIPFGKAHRFYVVPLAPIGTPCSSNISRQRSTHSLQINTPLEPPTRLLTCSVGLLQKEHRMGGAVGSATVSVESGISLRPHQRANTGFERAAASANP